MSYDLHLFQTNNGDDPRAIVGRLLRLRDRELNPGPVQAEVEIEKQRLAKSLIAYSSTLSESHFDFAGVARLEGTTEDEARRRYRHLELNASDHSGIQITLWDGSADISFPYWHSGEQARQVLSDVWEYLDVLQKWGGFITFDPQLDKVLDLGRDFDTVLGRLL